MLFCHSVHVDVDLGGSIQLSIGVFVILVSIDVGKGNGNRKRGRKLANGSDEVHMLDADRGLEPGVAGQMDTFFALTVDGDAPMMNHVEVADSFEVSASVPDT